MAVECPSANVLRELVAGTLDPTTHEQIRAHVETCEKCRGNTGTTEQSLPAFHETASAGALGLEATASPGVLGLEATALPTIPSRPAITVPPNEALMETQAASDAIQDPGDAPTLHPHHPDAATPLPATPMFRRRGSAPVVQGKQLGRFTLVERLGAGAMGVVWRAEDPKLGRQVALKVLKRADAGLTERLVREARSMAQVNHPNVVTVYEVGEAQDGTMFIAMELVTGQSLRAWQKAEKRTIPALVEAYIAAGRGLAAAHAAGLIHRDFKPDNVLVGDDGRMRVTDFGLAAAKPAEASDVVGMVARASRPNIGDVNLTTSGSVLGTPAYMAPEQFSGGNVDSRTDQFNFCVSLYEALYGERPFEGKSFTELGDNVMFGRLKAPPEDARVSQALRAILVRGLSAKPGDRFATMNELITELGRDRARPWRWTAIGAAALAGVLGLGLVADWIIRDRVGAQIEQSFALTGVQLQRAAVQLRDQFDTVSEIAYREAALRDVAGHHDQAEFGLGTPEQDQAELERLHNTLVSTDWVRLGDSTLAIADYKGRLLFTSDAPDQWGTDLKGLTPIKRALDAGQGDSVTLVPYDDPAFAASKIKVTPEAHGLAVVFARTLALGDKATEGSEARALYLQVQDGRALLDTIRLDAATRLALVAPNGYAVGDPEVTRGLVQEAIAAADVVEVRSGDRTYQVQARPIAGLDGQGTIGHVVMARPLGGVLSLFPGARLVFALTAFASLVLASAAYLRARSITHGHV
jgi:predicted Ser/Thr protein kinase